MSRKELKTELKKDLEKSLLHAEVKLEMLKDLKIFDLAQKADMKKAMKAQMQAIEEEIKALDKLK